MVNPTFYIGQQIGQNQAKSMRESRDSNEIDRILRQARASKDPEVLQDAMTEILSKVSPERQPQAIQLIQNSMQRLDAQSKQAREDQAAKKAGYTPGAPPAVQAQEVKERAKQQYLQGLGIGGQPIQNGQQQQVQPQEMIVEDQEQVLPQGQQTKRFPTDYTEEELVVLSGAPYKEVSEPAKAALQQRQSEKELEQKRNDAWTKFGMERGAKVLDEALEIEKGLPIKKTSLSLMQNAIANKDLSWWSWDNIADLTRIEGLRSPEGALFKTAGKEYFLGSIRRAGARPNQWIEQQISDMMPKIGRSTAANLSVARALENETDIEEERVRLTNEIYDQLRSENKDLDKLGPMVNRKLAEYAENKQEELFNDLRAIKSIDEGKPQKFHKVKNGTKISSYMVEALLKTFNNDPEKAEKEAKKLGYSIE